MGLRERKRRQRREHLTKVAYALFYEHGYDETTVEMIAAEADVSPRTFYRYFETKDGVLAEGGFEVVDRTVARLGGRRSLDALVATMAAVYAEFVLENHFEHYSRLLRQNPQLSDRFPTWRDRWSRHLAERLADEDDLALPTLDHRIRCRMAVQLMATAIDEWLYSGRERPIPELAAESLALLRAALEADRPS